MKSNRKTKIIVLIIIGILTFTVSYLSGLYIWPRTLVSIGLWNWGYYSRFVFIFYWLFIFLVDLYGVRNSTLKYKILNVVVLTSFLIEGLGIESSLGGANSMLCLIPPPSTYNGFRTAIAFSFIGSILVIIYLSLVVLHQVKKKIQNNRNSLRNSQDSEITGDFHRESYSTLSFISISLAFFHISFFFPSIFESIGCTRFSEAFIIPIGIIWLIPCILNVVFQIILKIIQIKK